MAGRTRAGRFVTKTSRPSAPFVPEYRQLSAIVVLGGVEREKFDDRRSRWRPELVKIYDEAKIYPDGKFLTVPISSTEDSQELRELLAMKRPPILPG
ncbi:DUF3788 family protein [Novosphingobium sp. G106]|uniref:DUF3788 family protein n=1 Tax=Novosphingobium sp. G106 TaxID=2849500 RepID=UPI0035C81830